MTIPVQFLAEVRSAEGWSVIGIIGLVVLVLALAGIVALSVRVTRRR